MASNAMQEMIVTTQNFRRKGMKERKETEENENVFQKIKEQKILFTTRINRLHQQTQAQADQDNTTWPPYGSIQKELQ